jgi:rubrerythrin
MIKESFKKIIDFAIDRELEAVDFYKELQELVKFQSQKNMLLELQHMEEGHVTTLENILKEKIENIQLKDEIKDLKISDYLVEKEPSNNMNYQDILIIAMKREENSTKLYKDLAEKVSDEQIKKVLIRLSQEEAAHKLRFEKLYDEVILKEN